MFALNLCKAALPQVEMSTVETDYESSSSTSGCFASSSTVTPTLANYTTMSRRQSHCYRRGTRAGEQNSSLEEREIRRKERNNAASRKSRALRKQRFVQMLQETERLRDSNTRLRAFIEELNSIMAESRAILLNKFASAVTSSTTTANTTTATKIDTAAPIQREWQQGDVGKV